MKKNNLLFSSLIIFLSFLIILLSSFLNKSQREGKVLLYTYNILKDQVARLTNEFIASCFTESDALDSDINLTNCLGDSLLLTDLLEEGPKVVFRYTELDCIDCVVTELSNLKYLGEKIGNNNIIVLTTYKQLRRMVSFRRTNNVEFEIYKVDMHALDIVADEINTPYVFFLGKDLILRHLYFPNKIYKDVSKSYYQSLISMYYDYWGASKD